MIDRERVIKGLERFKADFKPFCGNGSDWTRVDDAINLLKEYQEKQEGLPPAWQDRTQEHICQKCGGIVWQEDNYCSKCGQAVKWSA